MQALYRQCAPYPSLGGVHNWFQTSIIVHAISDHPTGPYTITGDALLGSGEPLAFDGTVTHNPHLVRLNSGLYLLYYIGMNCNLHPGLLCEHEQSIGVASSESLQGPWKRLGRPILTPDRCRSEERSSNQAPPFTLIPVCTLSGARP